MPRAHKVAASFVRLGTPSYRLHAPPVPADSKRSPYGGPRLSVLRIPTARALPQTLSGLVSSVSGRSAWRSRTAACRRATSVAICLANGNTPIRFCSSCRRLHGSVARKSLCRPSSIGRRTARQRLRVAALCVGGAAAAVGGHSAGTAAGFIDPLVGASLAGLAVTGAAEQRMRNRPRRP
ncbi:hypothetical protein SAMN04487926_111211 [Paraburkholderia steynii]|uniref:Uncharacterized protein n=1 Tax=Paraburkholderia steynii TaxID=1245441 RepID=A0A7Z7FJW8_9BURK|nr:hypothetical protein SAMN04487926_111211 [Paraburkholderia steynii]